MNGILSQATRALPNLVTVVAWHGCDHLGQCDPDAVAAIDQPSHAGRYLMPGSPLDFSAVPRVPVRRTPLLGENTDEILAEILHLTDKEIRNLHDAGLIATPHG